MNVQCSLCSGMAYFVNDFLFKLKIRSLYTNTVVLVKITLKKY